MSRHSGGSKGDAGRANAATVGWACGDAVEVAEIVVPVLVIRRVSKYGPLA